MIFNLLEDELQEYIKGIAGGFQTTAIKRIPKWSESCKFFLLASAYKSDVYTILWFIKCAAALCLKKKCAYLN